MTLNLAAERPAGYVYADNRAVVICNGLRAVAFNRSQGRWLRETIEVIADEPVTVVVDYAHTPEGIETVIETARTLSNGRVIVVFGAGGDRDQGKRPRMGQAASAADLVIVTTDNPRSEDPLTIAAEVLAGVDHPAAMSIIDRRQAIATALDSARPGDVVLILGKGHESTQEINGVFHPFSDQEIAHAWLTARSGGRAVGE